MTHLNDPISDTMFCILLALQEERHGYGVMRYVADLTGGDMVLGAGTVYTSLRKLQRAGWIEATRETDRRRYYVLTTAGERGLRAAVARFARLHSYGKELR